MNQFDEHLEFMTVWSLLMNYFQGDASQVLLWFMTPNSMLGNIAPKQVINCGDLPKVKKLICDMLIAKS